MDIRKSVIFDLNQKSSEEIRELLKAYQTAINININIISSVTDRFGTIIYANDKFCEVSKYKREELIGQNHRIINSGYHSSDFFKEVWTTIANGEPWHGEIKNMAKDGTLYWVDTVILPIRTPNGKTIQYLSLRTLITDKKIADEQRQEYSQKLSEMLHMTSHRVRAPLARCLGLMTLIEHESILTKDELNKVVLHLKSSALELDNFTKELTSFIHDLEKKYKEVVAEYNSNETNHERI